MSDLVFQVLIIFILFIANGIFAMSEIAVVSSRKVRLQQRAGEGDAGARAALQLSEEPNMFLSTVQLGVTLVGIFSGAFGGATIAHHVAGWLGSIPAVAPYAEPLALGLVVVAITYFSLVIGELVPKRLGLNDPEGVAARLAPPMRILSVIASPVVRLLSTSTDVVLRMLGARASEEPSITEEEIKVLMEQGTEAGTFEETEQDMVERVFRLGDRRVSGLMTPRPDIVWLDIQDPFEETRERMARSIHSRFPVCDGSLDNVRGVLHVKDLLAQTLFGQHVDLAEVVRRPLFVPETMRAFRVLELLKESGEQIALAVDEYGVVQGLVTLQDLFQAIVGDIPSGAEPGELEAVQREDGSWLMDGVLPVEDVKALLDLDELPGEGSGNYQTLGGFMMMHLGRIPAVSDHFEWDGLRFEVVDMDGNRVDKVLVVPGAGARSDEATAA